MRLNFYRKDFTNYLGNKYVEYGIIPRIGESVSIVFPDEIVGGKVKTVLHHYNEKADSIDIVIE